MHEAQQMVMRFQTPLFKMNHRPECEGTCMRALPSMDDSHGLRAHSSKGPGLTANSLYRGMDLPRFPKIAFRAAVDCLAMAGCVLFAALATLLFGL